MEDTTVGIDFGFGDTCVAVFNQDKATVVTNFIEERITPSVIAYT